MKKVIITALAFIVLAGCKEEIEKAEKETPTAETNIQRKIEKIKSELKPGEQFYANNMGLQLMVVKTTNDNGVFFTVPQEWLWESTMFKCYADLSSDICYKYMGHCKKWIIKDTIK